MGGGIIPLQIIQKNFISNLSQVEVSGKFLMMKEMEFYTQE